MSSGYRLEKIKGSASTRNWLFLPGGPGMGSEYMRAFIKTLDLPGTLWLADFPDAADQLNSISLQRGLCDIVKSLQPCILVGHSFAGMLALTMPELENLLTGMSLICSTPDYQVLQQKLFQNVLLYQLPDVRQEIAIYFAQPNAHTLKQLFIACAPYFFTAEEKGIGMEMLQNCHYNSDIYLWAQQEFMPSYKANWTPQKLPTLLIGGKYDRLLPISVFAESPDFRRHNIEMATVDGAGHFPWLRKQVEMNELLSKLI